MLRPLLFLGAFLMLFCETFATERSDDEMVRIAVRVLDKYSENTAFSRSAERAPMMVKRRDMFSVVCSPDAGFVLVSNDDRFREVLGYSSSTFDETDMPCGFEWYLDALGRSLKAMAGAGYTPCGIKPQGNVKPAVEPLIQTVWSQNSPYNDLCPTYVDNSGTLRHFYVGCGATAMSQVMYYYRHPLVGTGEATYSFSPRGGVDQKLSCKFDTVSLEWDKMVADYGHQETTPEQKLAVARLCSAVGISTFMNYTEENGSGTNVVRMGNALKTNFGYSPDIQDINRSSYKDAAWMNAIFDELSSGRPILYRGRTTDGKTGHLFILDGYDADGLVHVNWGWGKKYDAYIDINDLTPEGSEIGYPAEQQMLVYVRPSGTPLELSEVVMETPGTLSQHLPKNSHLVRRLKIKGLLNNEDFKTIRQLAYTGQALTHLDLSQADVENGTLPVAAFDSCHSLISVVLPDKLERIGDKAFINCKGLATVHLGSSLRSIGNNAFCYCSCLNSVLFPASLDTIGDWAFFGCWRLQSPLIPRGLRFLGYGVFNSTNIQDFQVEDGNSNYATVDGMLTNSKQNKLVAFPSVRTEVNIPECIDTIGMYAFRYSSNLEKIHIPGTVKVICEYAFQNCTKLQQLTIDKGLRMIRSYAFNNCDNLRTLQLPATIDSLERHLFINCENIEQVTMSADNPKFSIVNNLLLSKDEKTLVQSLLTDVETCKIPGTVERLGRLSLVGIKMKKLNIPSNVKQIGKEAIYYCKELTEIIIEKGVEEIDHFAFNGCSGLTSIHLPSSLKKVGQAIFVNCTNLNSVTIGSESEIFSVIDNALYSKDNSNLIQCFVNQPTFTIPPHAASIGNYAFRYCDKLKELTIPSSVKTFGYKILLNCPVMQHVYYYSPAPAELKDYVLKDCNVENTTLHVPKGCLSNYLSTPGWDVFKTVVDDLQGVVPGDANDDEKVDIVDVTLTISYILGQNPLGFNEEAADVNGDGTINIVDVTSIIDFILGE